MCCWEERQFHESQLSEVTKILYYFWKTSGAKGLRKVTLPLTLLLWDFIWSIVSSPGIHSARNISQVENVAISFMNIRFLHLKVMDELMYYQHK